MKAPANAKTIIDVLKWRADRTPDAEAYRFLAEPEAPVAWTWAELSRRVDQVATAVQEYARPGDRALILCPQGLDYIAAFLGSLAMGVIAVPSWPPRAPRQQERVRALVAHCEPSIVLSSGSIGSRLADLALPLVDVGQLNTSGVVTPIAVLSDDIAFLQYTSGSTGTPRGVVVRHRHLMANQEMIWRTFGHDDSTVVGGWLPFFHDMGLIGNVLQPLYAGARCVLMSPAAFVQDPAKWLRLISDYGVTTSGGPDFAYDLCVRRIAAEQRAAFDLRSWRVAFNGAEPVRERTLQSFTDAFAPSGFRASAWLPCYGLAEATLLVSGLRASQEPTVMWADRAALTSNRLDEGLDTPVVSCGKPDPGVQVRILVPGASDDLPEGAIGEICLEGPAITEGYWKELPRASALLRTGDLGTLRSGELYVTGRLKDIVIVRGRNYAPHDLEQTALSSDPHLEGGLAAAFLQEDDPDRLTLVLECRTSSDYEPVLTAVRAAISETFELELSHIRLVRTGLVPRTTSGKVQRSICRELVEQDRLPAFASWTRPIQLDPVDDLSALLGVDINDLDPATPVSALGLSSLKAIELSHRLQLKGIAVPALDLLCGITVGDLQTAPRVLCTPAEAELTRFSLSENQRSLYLLHVRDPLRSAEQISRALLAEDLSEDALVQALAAVMARHPLLRSRVVSDADEPMQEIIPDLPVPIRFRSAGSVEEARSFAADETAKPWDLERAPLWRVRLYRLPQRAALLLFDFHHLIADLWSLTLFWKDLDAALAGRSLAGVPFPYSSYVAVGQRTDYADSLEWWRNKLRGELPLLQLPLQHPRSARQEHRGGLRKAVWSQELTSQVSQLAATQRVTPFSVLLALFEVLLSRYSGQKEFLLGTPDSGRSDARWREVFGYLVNPIVLRADLRGAPSLTTLVTRVNDELRQSLRHAAVPFASVVETVQPPRTPDRAVLCDAMFVFQEAPPQSSAPESVLLGVDGAPVPLGGASVRPIELDRGVSQRDLTLAATSVSGRLHFLAEFDSALFDPWFIDQMLADFEHLATEWIRRPEAPVEALEVQRYPRAERPQPAVQLETLGDRFRRTARDYSQRTAIIDDEASLTYGELDAASDRIASRLIQLGAGPERLVALYVERSAGMLVALLGVLKSGAAYLPLDPTYPRERIEYILADAHPVAVIVDEVSVGTTEVSQLRLGDLLDADDSDVAHPAGTLNADGNTSAYVIYTSGSTGKPKGCQVTHGNVLHLFDGVSEAYGFTPSDVWTMFHSVAFDFSVWEIWGAWLFGGAVLVTPQELTRDPNRFSAFLAEKQVTVLSQTPTAFRSLLGAAGEKAHRRFPSLRWVFFGGEALDFACLRSWYGPNGESSAALVNMYGITETTVHVTQHLVQPHETRLAANSNIGEPLPGLDIFLLDESMHEVPNGVPGEICVAGGGLARGYLGRAALTAERFVPHPYGRPGERIYRSGDLARRLPSGQFEYLGRMDQQVQVRGFRVELGEIESALALHPDVAQAVVVARSVPVYSMSSDDLEPAEITIRDQRRYLKAVPALQAVAHETRLLAYIRPRVDNKSSASDLRAHLERNLPFYMIPSAFVWLQEFPLTDSGKIHRAALPMPVADRPAEEFVGPANSVERALAEAWSAALGLPCVGVEDNFFAIGGDSIRAIQVVARARERGYAIAVQDLYRHQSVRALASEIGRSTSESLNDGAATRTEPFSRVSSLDRERLPAGVVDAYPLTRMQAGLLFHSASQLRSSVYRATFLYEFEGAFVESRFRGAAQALMRRHPILRTSFDLGTYSAPLQLVWKDVQAPVTMLDLQHLQPERQQERITQWFSDERSRDFDPTEPAMLRWTVHRLGTERFTVGLTCHDAILDGWSTAIVLTELLRLYAGESPEALAPTGAYRDFVALEQQALLSAADSAYWSEVLHDAPSGQIPVRQVPAGESSGPKLAVADVPIGASISNSVQQIARESGISLKHLLLAVHLRVLATLTGSLDVITGLEANGRAEQLDGETSVGQHLNTVPFRSRLAAGSWLELARQVASQEQDMLPHRRYPYAAIQKQQGGVELYQSTFNFTHFHMFQRLRQLPDLRVVSGYGSELTHYILKTECNVDAFSGRLNLDIIFDESRMGRQQALEIAGYYRKALESVAADPATNYSATCLLTQEEQEYGRLLAHGPSVHRSATSMVELCEQQRDRTPDLPAVIFEKESITFGELHARANRMARTLRAMGVGAEVAVGVHLERSLDLIVALLAVLKAGGAYVPLEPTYPADHLMSMADDAVVRVVITNSKSRWPGSHSILTLDLDALLEDDADLGLSVDPKNAIYVLFTSGSTGRPKGAVNTHEALVNRICWMQDTWSLGSDDRVLQKTSIAFDVSGWEFWWPLISGAALLLARPGMHTDSRYLADVIRREGVTTIHFVPSLLREFLHEPAASECLSLRHVICSGEELTPDLAARFAQRLPAELHNLYGPTEAAIDVSAWKVSGDERGAVPIGRPIANISLEVLDDSLHPVPEGTSGELYIGGIGLARGYAGRPDLTAERFVPYPGNEEPGARLYRTGDLARRLPDGALEFLGRADRQVKLHGARIELSEIEAALRDQPCITAAVAEVANDSNAAKLIAHIVVREGFSWDERAVRESLAARLPRYAIPSRFQLRASMPLTPSGKLDRKRLGETAPVGIHEDLEALLVHVEQLSEEDLEQFFAAAAEGERNG